jgi:hypothetical protein
MLQALANLIFLVYYGASSAITGAAVAAQNLGLPMATRETVRLTMAQALVRYLAAQRIVIDGIERGLCGGVFAIFGHGNVTCLGEALYESRAVLPTWRGQNEQSMGFAAVAYAKANLRRRLMVATSSIRPGATNMVTAAAVAHTNRLPVLFVSGDTYHHRLPNPVLQQVERFDDPTITVNDAFKPVTRYWDRITHPAQLIQSLPAAIVTGWCRFCDARQSDGRSLRDRQQHRPIRGSLLSGEGIQANLCYRHQGRSVRLEQRGRRVVGGRTSRSKRTSRSSHSRDEYQPRPLTPAARDLNDVTH